MKFFLITVLCTLALFSTSAIGGVNNSSVPFQCQNGRDAQSLQASFAKIDFTKACPTEGQTACNGEQVAQCSGGKWSNTDCAGGTQCCVLPLVNKPGTSVTCDTTADQTSRINNALATCPKKVKRSRKLRR